MNLTQNYWQFTSRFQRDGLGWESELAIEQIKAAVAEVKRVARKDKGLAAEGSVEFLELLPGAVRGVDRSSGRVESTICDAIEELVKLIASTRTSKVTRQKWLNRLWQSMLSDEISCLDTLGDNWGDLCTTSAIASEWADQLLAIMQTTEAGKGDQESFFHVTMACLSALFKAKRYDELFDLLKLDRHRLWDYQKFAAKALAATGKVDDALEFANNHEGWQIDNANVAATCEEILLAATRREEAFARYAIAANRQSTNVGTFRALKKKYNEIAPETILQSLIEASPGEEGKWFATAKDLKLFPLAIRLAKESQCDPLTLTRASKDFCESQPQFALQAGLAALDWMLKGHGYQVSSTDLSNAFAATLDAARQVGEEKQTLQTVREKIRQHASNEYDVADTLERLLNDAI